MFRRISEFALVAACACISPALRAEPVTLVETAHVKLSDLVQTANVELAEIDLGRAPPAGASRLFAREDVLHELNAQGIDGRSLKLPAVVRVQSAARHFRPAEIRELVTPRLTAALPAGVSLKEFKISRGIVASPRIAVGSVRLPKLPRRAGSVDVTAVADLMHEGDVVARLPLTLTLEVSEQAAAPVVDKGARVDLFIVRGAARISASGVALEPVDIGEIASFKVSTTQKVLRARLETATRALVVTP